MRTGTRVRGVNEIVRKLTTYEQAVKKAVQKGVREAAQLVARATKAKAPKRTGLLKRSIGYRILARRDGGGSVGVVGPRRDYSAAQVEQSRRQVAAGKRKRVLVAGRYKRSSIAHLVEFGRAAVKVGARKGKRSGRLVLSDGKRFYGKSVAPAAPKPFLRPAWQSTKGAAEKIMVKHQLHALLHAGGSR